MTVPVIGAEDPGHEPGPIAWALSPARPEPIDLDSLDLDELTERLNRSSPKEWRVWPLYGSFLLFTQVVSIFLAGTLRQHESNTVAVECFLLYIYAGALYILLAVKELKATASARPRLRRNQAFVMCGAAFSLAAALPWSVLMWAKDGSGTDLISAFWPIIITLPFALPPQPLGDKTLRPLHDGVLPSAPRDLNNLISHLRFRRGDWRFPVRLAAIAQTVVVLVIACSLLGPYALGWARPLPHGGALLPAAFLLVGFAGIAAWRLIRRFGGAPRRRWDIVLGAIWLAISISLLCLHTFVISKLSPQLNQLSLMRTADWFILAQATSLITLRTVPLPAARD